VRGAMVEMSSLNSGREEKGTWNDYSKFWVEARGLLFLF
jgi:hypothetical protein